MALPNINQLEYSKFDQSDPNNPLVRITSGISLPVWDYCSLTQASTTDTWVFKTGGSGGTTRATITVTYTDSGKGTISTVVKT